MGTHVLVSTRVRGVDWRCRIWLSPGLVPLPLSQYYVYVFIANIAPIHILLAVGLSKPKFPLI